jgi:hypothetical protein
VKHPKPPIQIIDGKWYAVGWGGEPHIEICCACSLAHRIRYRVHAGLLEVSYQTLPGLTKALRRKEGIKVTRVHKN